jgi:riboflavin-specific deaminase-like protein
MPEWRDPSWVRGAVAEVLSETRTGDVAIGSPPVDGDSAAWAACLRDFRDPTRALPPRFADLFGPLRIGAVDDIAVIAQIGQSLDGRIATESGHSRYINGPAGIDHLHRLRALVDVVIVGVGAALADDPRLTVRRVTGPNPARVVIDPNARLPESARIFAEDGASHLRVVAAGARVEPTSKVKVLALPASRGRIDPALILAAMAERGWRRILIEGGADTISGFLDARLLDRLHVLVAPMIFGSGRPSFILPPIESAHQAQRVPVTIHRLGDDILFDCDLSARRGAVGRATPPSRPTRAAAPT